jgi:excinuclease ABC subunit C
LKFRTHPQKTGNRPAQARRVSAQGPLRHGHLRRQGARFAQARQPVFPSSAAHGLGLEIQRAGRGDCDFDFHVVRSEPEALLLESKLIKEFKPRFNISLRDDKRFLMLKVNLNDPIPNFTFTRLKKDDGARYFGPFVEFLALRNTVALARKQFNLRGCRVFTPGEADYKHCLYAHLKYCTAPCVGNVTREQYLEQVRAACNFLEGQCREMQGQLEAEMKKAAAAQDFEKAADLRDLLRDLKDTWKKTEKFARVPYTLPLAINPAKRSGGTREGAGPAAPPQRIEGFDISNISGTFAVASLVSFKNGRPDRANYRRFKIKTVTGQDDFACMAEVVQRRYSRLKREAKPMPDLILIDGGKGQLGMACAELKKLGLEKIPVIGLAKEFEEIYLPDKSEPLRLGLDHPAVKLLQRVRDECHRVANSYNAQLRLKKISESVLDEFPGIGERRKAALLKKFGSVQRLKMATLEQLAAVPGFGGKAAEELKKFLAASPRPASGILSVLCLRRPE